MDKIVMYGTTWCADCKKAKSVFEEMEIEYEWINIDEQSEFVDYVIDINDGMRIVPTIVFPDGSHLSEPSYRELESKLAKMI